MPGSDSSQSSQQTTSDSAITLAAARLQTSIIRQIDKDTFCAVERLGELAIHARDVRRAASSPEHRMLAFVLESAFRKLEYDQSDRPFYLSEWTARKRLFIAPPTAAANFLAGKGGDPLSIADALIRAVSEALPN